MVVTLSRKVVRNSSISSSLRLEGPMKQQPAAILIFLLVFAPCAEAASTVPFGQVTALNNVSQLGSVVSTAGFDLGIAGTYTSNTYAAGGMVLQGTNSGFG